MRKLPLFTNRIAKYLKSANNTTSLGKDIGMGAGRTNAKKVVPDLPAIALRFRALLKKRGWTPSDLAREAEKRFGEHAAVAASFRRLIRADAPESDSKAVIQAEEILAGGTADDEPDAQAVVPLIEHLPAARDATEEQIVDASRKLMNSRHASLHALLTLLLARK